MNWDMLGHEWAVRLLSEHVASGYLRHAYLFTGPQGIGRRTLALRLAQAINCQQPLSPGQPCGVCSTCTHLAAMQHPDLSVVKSEQEGSILKVEQVRQLQHSLSLAPYQAKYRVALLLRFEEANASAANAMLKTLEEPSPQVVILLTASDAESLLPTITSRCEVVRLRPLPLETVRQGLIERWNVPDEQAMLLAHLSNGRPGYALNLFQHPEFLEQRRSWLEDHHRLLHANRVERFAYAEAINKEKGKENLRPILQIWLSFWRDILLRAARASAPITNLDQAETIEDLSSRLDLSTARRTVSAIENTMSLLDKNVNARLATEVLLLDIPRL